LATRFPNRHAKPEQVKRATPFILGICVACIAKNAGGGSPTMLSYRATGELSGTASQIREDVPGGDEPYFFKSYFE